MIRAGFLLHNQISVDRGGERSTAEIIKWLIDCGIDVVAGCPGQSFYDVNFYLAWGSAIKAAYESGFPYIAFLRSWDFDRYGDEDLGKWLKSARVVIVNSEKGKERLYAKGITNTIVSYVPVEVSEIPISPKYHTFVGIRKSGEIPEVLANAYQKEKFRVVRISEDDHRAEYIDLPNLKYIDSFEDANDLYTDCASYIYPLPINGLGTGRCTIEAQLHGIPVLGQAGCGIEEFADIVVPENTGHDIWVKKFGELLELEKNREFIYCKRAEMNIIYTAIVDSFYPEKKPVRIFLRGGVGNIMEMIPALRMLYNAGYGISAKLEEDKYKLLHDILWRTGLFVEINCNTDNAEKWDCNINTRSEKPERYWYADHVSQKYGISYNRLPEKCLINTQDWRKKDNILCCPYAVNERYRYKIWPHWGKMFETVDLIPIGADSDIKGSGIPHPINTSVEQAVNMMASAKGFIGNDGGLSHIAADFCETEVIYGATSERKNLPHGARAIAIKDMICRPCQDKNTGMLGNCSGMECMEKLTPDEVANQSNLLSERLGLQKKPNRMWACVIVYNDKDLLEQSLISLKKAEFKIMVIDGKFAKYPGENLVSTDGSIEIAKKYADMYIPADASFLSTQMTKRSKYTELVPDGEYFFVIDSDEEYRGKPIDANTLTEDVYSICLEEADRKQSTTSIRIWKKYPDLKYMIRHCYLFRSDNADIEAQEKLAEHFKRTGGFDNEMAKRALKGCVTTQKVYNVVKDESGKYPIIMHYQDRRPQRTQENDNIYAESRFELNLFKYLHPGTFNMVGETEQEPNQEQSGYNYLNVNDDWIVKFRFIRDTKMADGDLGTMIPNGQYECSGAKYKAMCFDYSPALFDVVDYEKPQKSDILKEIEGIKARLERLENA